MSFFCKIVTCSFPVSYTHLDVYKRQVLDQLLEGDYEAVYESFREDIRADLTAQSVQDLVEPVFQEAGDYQELKSARVTGSTEGEEHGIAQLLCIFSQEKVSIRVAFDPDMELIGLSLSLIHI